MRTIRSKVVGVTKKNADNSSRQKYIKEVRNGDSLTLEPEPNNEYDSYAIKVLNNRGNQIGYIRAELAEELTDKMENNYKILAKVTEVTGGASGKSSLGVNISLDIYEPSEDPPVVKQKLKIGCGGIIAVLVVIGVIINLVKGLFQ